MSVSQSHSPVTHQRPQRKLILQYPIITVPVSTSASISVSAISLPQYSDLSSVQLRLFTFATRCIDYQLQLLYPAVYSVSLFSPSLLRIISQCISYPVSSVFASTSVVHQIQLCNPVKTMCFTEEPQWVRRGVPVHDSYSKFLLWFSPTCALFHGRVAQIPRRVPPGIP